MRIALRLVVAGAMLAVAASRACAEEPELSGRWKFVVSPLTDTEFLLLEPSTTDGKLTAKVVASVPFVMAPEVELTRDGQRVTLVMKHGAFVDKFEGAFVKQGPREGQVLGAFKFRDRTYPARLERTEEEKLGRATAAPEMLAYTTAMRERDTKAKVEKLREVAKDAQGPIAAAALSAILQSAESAELSADQVRQLVSDLVAAGKDYGAPIVADYQERALNALQGKKPYAELALSLAQEAEKALDPKATLQQQASVLSAVASSARLLGKDDLATATDARLAKIETALDEEYHAKVPPFKPEKFAGRENASNDRVVLMELFTGAQCPPCVAADVAFDALLKTYQPKELVTLQYHLHIPGPDPLTNADTEARARFYKVNSTPTTLFNGVAAARGGGGMANAESKYGQYREVIDPQLANPKQAKIDLKLSRSGNKIEIVAVAQATKPPAKASQAEEKKADEKKDEEKKDEEAKEPQLRLRLALTEESIRYVGGNQLRFHHHVVRGFPGGIDGKELVAGEGTVNEMIDLEQVRQTLAAYLTAKEQGRPFPNALPKIELKGLSVVAFIQNDADQSIWHAVTMPVPQE